jgi:hypothetical protein
VRFPLQQYWNIAEVPTRSGYFIRGLKGVVFDHGVNNGPSFRIKVKKGEDTETGAAKLLFLT